MKQLIILLLAWGFLGPAQAIAESSGLDESMSSNHEGGYEPLPDVGKESEGYRPPWADPNAQPPYVGVDEDPTPFNPSDVEDNSGLGN